MPAKITRFGDVNIGDEMPVLRKDFGELAKLPIAPQLSLVRYAGASGDFNPIHTVHQVGEMAGMGGVIVHGMLVMGFVGQAITDWIPNKYLKKFGVRFRAVTKPDEVIVVSGKVTDKKTEGGENIIICEVTAANENGDVKVTGKFEASLPV